MTEDDSTERIGIVVVAYNAESTLVSVLDRIPLDFRRRVSQVLVCDDASSDRTYTISKEYEESGDLPLRVIRRPQNLGYGGNQKAAYQQAMRDGVDIVVLLHGDGQYAPEVIESLVAPIEEGRADAVFGSRMMEPGSARSGGMPLYKYVGNRILSTFSNVAVGMDLSEWHSGYRAYRTSALRDIPFETNSDGFDFDTEIILQLHEASKKILEVPIPTYYGDEICYVNGLGYAKDVVVDVVKYRVHKMGFGSGETAFTEQAYRVKCSPGSSHQKLLNWLNVGEPKRVLDVGCSDGRFGELLKLYGHEVVGIDTEKLDSVQERLDGFFLANLNEGLPSEVGNNYEVVVAADVLEHLVEPGALIAQFREVLAPGGVVVVSIPNIAHWYPRLRIGLGRFDYDRRGIFDRGHLRFFTRKSFARMVEHEGFRIRRFSSTGLPFEVAERGGGVPTRVVEALRQIERMGLAIAPSLFSYQLLFELEAK